MLFLYICFCLFFYCTNLNAEYVMWPATKLKLIQITSSSVENDLLLFYLFFVCFLLLRIRMANMTIMWPATKLKLKQITSSSLENDLWQECLIRSVRLSFSLQKQLSNFWHISHQFDQRIHGIAVWSRGLISLFRSKHLHSYSGTCIIFFVKNYCELLDVGSFCCKKRLTNNLGALPSSLIDCIPS